MYVYGFRGLVSLGFCKIKNNNKKRRSPLLMALSMGLHAPLHGPLHGQGPLHGSRQMYLPMLDIQSNPKPQEYHAKPSMGDGSVAMLLCGMGSCQRFIYGYRV